MKLSRLWSDRKGTTNIGGLILGLVVSMIMIFVALLLGGVLSGEISEQFTSFGVNGTWVTLFTSTQQIAQSAISVAVIGFLVAAFMVILGMFGVFGRKK